MKHLPRKRWARRLRAFFICTALCLLLSGCESKTAELPSETETPIAAENPVVYEGLVISEVMAHNSAILCRGGEFPDWVELCNRSSEAIPLSGCVLSDGVHSYVLDGGELRSGEFLLLCAGKGAADLSFALSEEETVTLFAPDGKILSSCCCAGAEENESLVLSESGVYVPSSAPTPGFDNSEEGYAAFQRSLPMAEDIRISEVFAHGSSDLGTYDWVELYNSGESAVSLADYSLSDRLQRSEKLLLPDILLAPGEYYICPLGEESFSLSAREESVYLFRQGALHDSLCLAGIPASGSVGREAGEGKLFYAVPTPGTANARGCRFVAEKPVLQGKEGVFAPGERAEISLCAKGEIHYTLDGSLPDRNSPVWTEPLNISADTVLRAIAIEEGKLDSPVLCCSWIFTDTSLPVVNLVGEPPAALERMKKSLGRDPEVQAVFSYYGNDFSVSVPCGVNLSGNASKKVAAKSFKLSFRSCYGADVLCGDLFGTGISEYGSILLKKGIDAGDMVFKNELFETLALSFTERSPVRRSQFCRMYINGSYWGLVSMKEDFSRSYFAARYGGDKDEVDYFKFPTSNCREFEQTVMALCKGKRALSDADYEQFCTLVDIDSLIDFMIVKGIAGDKDYYPNIGLFRSPAAGGRWRFMLWDFDCAFTAPFGNMVAPSNEEYFSMSLSVIVKTLLGNEQFRTRFLNRLAEALSGAFSGENMLTVMESYRMLLREEVEEDWGVWHFNFVHWEPRLDACARMIESGQWRREIILHVKSLPFINSADVDAALGQ